MTFIKLTSRADGESVYFNVANINFFCRHTLGNKTIVYTLSDDNWVNVTETPEEIMTLIEQANDTKGVM